MGDRSYVMHDTGRSGGGSDRHHPHPAGLRSCWIVWYCTDTKPGDNQYGPDPKHGASGGYQLPAAPYGSGQYGG